MGVGDGYGVGCIGGWLFVGGDFIGVGVVDVWGCPTVFSTSTSGNVGQERQWVGGDISKVVCEDYQCGTGDIWG